uniref:Uncharacterized protein n=1 Tax=Oryza nivara TaxID=4536 RepID=A0A0E0HQA2_ORYNI
MREQAVGCASKRCWVHQGMEKMPGGGEEKAKAWGWGTRRQKRSLSRRRRVLNNNLSEILVNSLRGKIMFFYHDDIKIKVPSGLMDTPEDQ